MDATGALVGGVLTITGGTNTVNRIELVGDGTSLFLSDAGRAAGTFASAAVTNIIVNANGPFNTVRFLGNIPQPTVFNPGPGTNQFFTLGTPSIMNGGPGSNRLIGGSANDVLNGGTGTNVLAGGVGQNLVFAAPGAARDLFVGSNLHDAIFPANPPPIDVDLRNGSADPPDLSATLGLPPTADADPANQLTAAQVNGLLGRAAAAINNDSAIVAIVDRSGRVLGVRVEGGVSPIITGTTANLVFAIDGALAEARTGAFFGNDQAPLTSRTIQFISQTTITQQMIQSNPSIDNPQSTLKGPGTVGPQGIGGHFPPGVQFTPQVDLFAIEDTNRDTTLHPIYDANGNIINRVALPQRFNVATANIPANILAANDPLVPPDSYGFISGIQPNAMPRGIGTLPGGLPIYNNGVVVGGIGIFFPGTTGFASEENSALSAAYDPTKPDLSQEAEFAALSALGGVFPHPSGTLGGIAPIAGISAVPPGTNLSLQPGPENGRIDLVGITLPLFGPQGTTGPETLFQFGQTLGVGDPNSGANAFLPGGGAANTLNGTPVPEGWLVTPHAGPSGLSAADVTQMIEQGVQQALITRAAIRLGTTENNFDANSVMVFAVADKQTGEILGLFRMPDSTIFSIDVAVAKARNVAYYADPTQLQPIDQLPGVQAGTAFTNRTFRYLVEPRFPEGIDGAAPGPFSILNDGGSNPVTGAQVGAALPANAFQSVYGHDAFFPQTNFRDPNNPLNQNGIVFFPGSSPLYKFGNQLVGGVGISGDGVDQDDVVTNATFQGFGAPASIQTADQVFIRGIRLPYQKFNRQPINT